MRPDMDKVIVERPRLGSRSPSCKKGYRKYLQSLPVDELPRHEPMLGRWKGRQKHLNEHLGPMRRFLRSNVGRPWNSVHQDLCEHVSFDNAVQGHVLVHIYQYVHRHVEVHDSGTVYAQSEWGRKFCLSEDDMYVCPTTGILKVVKPHRCHKPKARIVVGGFKQCLRRGNEWWEVRLCNLHDFAGDQWDVWLERDVTKMTEQECIATYGGKLFAISKRPLTPDETRQLYRRLRQKSRSR